MLVLSILAMQVQPDTSKMREGYLLHEEASVQTIYYYRIVKDSTIYVRQGIEGTNPALSLPPLVVRTLNEELEELSPRDSSQVDRFALSLEDNRFMLNLAQRVDLLFYLVLVLMVAWIPVLILFRRKLNKEKHQQQHLYESRLRLAEDREAERLRLAQELHDGPVQDLHAIRIRLNMKGPYGQGTAAEMEDDLLHVIRELRAISEDLRPPALSPFGLGTALRAYIERFQKRFPDLDITSTIAEDGQGLPERVRLALFRICQEALNNVVQHARATRAWICYTLEPKHVVLEVRDNGDGFDVPKDWIELAHDGHYGLLGMLERAESIDASINITSTPGEGSCIRVKAARHSESPQDPIAQ